MQMDGRIAADPAGCYDNPPRSSQAIVANVRRIGERAIILIGADVAVLAEGAAHVAGGEEDRAGAVQAAMSSSSLKGKANSPASPSRACRRPAWSPRGDRPGSPSDRSYSARASARRVPGRDRAGCRLPLAATSRRGHLAPRSSVTERRASGGPAPSIVLIRSESSSPSDTGMVAAMRNLAGFWLAATAAYQPSDWASAGSRHTQSCPKSVI